MGGSAATVGIGVRAMRAGARAAGVEIPRGALSGRRTGARGAARARRGR